MAGLTADAARTDGSVVIDEAVRAADVAPRMQHWGFLAHPDLPDAPGPAFLLVALRPAPTLLHYDPEAVDYWVTEHGRGGRRTLTHDSPMPLSQDYSWGLIRLVDRLGVSNEYLTFGGHLDAASVEDVVVAAFSSPAPLLRRGGHSQGWDDGADAVGAFFARLMVAVDFTPGFEAALAAASPLTRYAAFIRDASARRPGVARAASAGWPDEPLDRLLRAETARLATEAPREWRSAAALLVAAFDG
ncbi:MAG TPA: hypothetical protein VFV72_14035 [Candidatus Limnocylindrales bacterium]|nr:hypothetical protein [Candidatus Limnocylindrales bacterium]